MYQAAFTITFQLLCYIFGSSYILMKTSIPRNVGCCPSTANRATTSGGDATPVFDRERVVSMADVVAVVLNTNGSLGILLFCIPTYA